MESLAYLRADTLSPEALVTAFNRSFQGYLVPMTHTADSLQTMMRVNDVALEHSFVAQDAAGELVGVVLLAIRGERGWIGGMGLAPEWRGHGQAAPLMQAALDEARGLRLASVGLEVLAENIPAHRLYLRLGFANVRSLDVFMGALASNAVPAAGNAATQSISVKRALTDFGALHPVPMPWQRDLPSLARMSWMLRALALMDGRKAHATLIYMPSGNGYSIMDFGARAMTAQARRDDALVLIRALVAETPAAPLRAINVPPGDALGDALKALGCPIPHTQWEMLLKL